MWTRKAIPANTERPCRSWVMRHVQPWKALTSELLTPAFSGGQRGTGLAQQGTVARETARCNAMLGRTPFQPDPERFWPT